MLESNGPGSGGIERGAGIESSRYVANSTKFIPGRQRPETLGEALDAAGIRLRHHRPGQHRVPCPACNRSRRDDALGVTIELDGAAVWHCFRCDMAGGWKPREPIYVRPSRPLPKSSELLRWSDTAAAIWRRGVSIKGTLAEVYLRHRGCAVPAESDLRYLPPTEQHPPTMAGRVTDFVTGQPMTLHFTKLAPDGRGKASVDKPKLLLRGHQKQGGIIRLCSDVTTGLGLAEGIETALAVVAGGWSPVWSAIDAGNLAALPVLPGIESLTVFADHDDAGIKGADALVARWRAAGREARVIPAPKAGTDWADCIGRAAA